MASVTTLIFFILLLFIMVAEGEKKKKIDKIIIHVPYKIHKHHHTHTKYKIITVPTPKKENTVIYLKEEFQPIIKHNPTEPVETKLIKTQSKTSEPFIPPHQESALPLLSSIANYKEQNLMPKDQQQHYSTIVDDQKPLESYTNQNAENFVPNYTFKPILLPSHENFIPNFSFKPMVLPQQNVFAEKLLLNPIMHQSYENIHPKFTYQPMLHLPSSQFNLKYTFKPMLSFPKILHDNMHTGSQVYNTITPSRPKATSYEVKEENHEDLNAQMVKQNGVPLPTMKPMRKGKSSLTPAPSYQFKSTGSMFHSNPDYEYEHVGYLIIDGNSKKVVGKNFKDEIHLSR